MTFHLRHYCTYRSSLLLVTTLKSFGINREYQRAVLFRLGRLGEMKGPGWYWLIPFVDRVVKVDTRIITYQLETQETITRDGVAVRVNAVLWFRAESPIQVGELRSKTGCRRTVQAAETALRDAIGQSDLDNMLKDRVSINRRLQELLREASIKWGVEIDLVEVKDVDIPEQMQRAIAKEAEAIREKRARIVRAEGEQEAAAKLSHAARNYRYGPGALELRRLQTLSEIGVEHNTTIVAMLPVELVHAARKIAGMPQGGERVNGVSRRGTPSQFWSAAAGGSPGAIPSTASMPATTAADHRVIVIELRMRRVHDEELAVRRYPGCSRAPRRRCRGGTAPS